MLDVAGTAALIIWVSLHHVWSKNEPKRKPSTVSDSLAMNWPMAELKFACRIQELYSQGNVRNALADVIESRSRFNDIAIYQ